MLLETWPALVLTMLLVNNRVPLSAEFRKQRKAAFAALYFVAELG